MNDEIKKGLLGIVVDDAVIVGENIYRHIEKGEDLKTAARIISVDQAINEKLPQ